MSRTQESSLPAETAGPDTGLLFLERFQSVSVRWPGRVAVSCGRDTLTYRDLDSRSNQLAAELREAGAGRETIVAISLPRRAEAITAILGVLKAGAAYLWLTPALPSKRRRFMLKDSGARILVTDADSARDVEEHFERILHPPTSSSAVAAFGWPSPASDDLAYLIYTSGSTGEPKAVMIEHRSLGAFVEWGSGAFTEHELSGVLLSSSLAFDASVFELYVPLAGGGRVVLVENLFALDAAERGVTLINSVPSLMRAFLKQRSLPRSAATIVLVGERLSAELADLVLAQPSVTRLVNAYGPTEDTCFSTFAEVKPGQTPTIGRPLPGTRAYVLRGDRSPAPAGEPGELWLGGVGLARGYRGAAELTSRRFITDPLPGQVSGRLYQTGDLARWEPDGTLQHLGRMDQQLKVRGVRIEPAEVESNLLRHPAVRETAVTGRRGAAGETELVAYVVTATDSRPTPADLRKFLSHALPDAMIPTSITFVAVLPLNPNGKLDLNRLPELEPSTNQTTTTGLERQLAEIWQEVLGVEDLPGPNDDFFDLGGQSLMAFHLFELVETRLGGRLGPRDVMEAPTVARMAARIASGGSASTSFTTIKGAGSRPPWIYVHAGLGAGLALRRFAGGSPDQPMCALQAIPDRRDMDGPLPTVENIAKGCVAELRRHVPHGPYLLGGHSLGGHIAFEMACRLQAEGEEVLMLALFDSVAPHVMRWRGRVSARGREVLGTGPEQRRTALTRAGIGFVARKLKGRARHGRDTADSSRASAAELVDSDWEQQMLERERSYRPGRFRGDIVVYPTLGTARYAGSVGLGWAEHVDGRVSAVRVGGDHLSMLSSPHVEGIAADVADRLDAVHRRRMR